jgi:hypothetical protein
MILGEIELEETDYQLLNSKSTILIPGSFNKKWPIHLLSMDIQEIKYNASIDVSKSMVSVSIENMQNGEKDGLLDEYETRKYKNAKIVSVKPVNLPLRTVLSPDSSSLDVECSINNQLCEVSINRKSAAEGSLIPLADGYGLILNSIKKY